MRQFVKNLLLFLVSASLTLVSAALFLPDASMVGVMGVELKKLARVKEMPGERLIFVGGSNLLYGLNSPEIEKCLGRPVVNMGHHAGLGLCYQMAAVMPHLHQGDVVVLSPEYENFKSGDQCFGKTLLVSLLTDVVPWGEVSLMPGHERKLVRWIFQSGARKILRLMGLRAKPGAIDLMSFNDQGDLTEHWGRTNLVLATKSKLAKELEIDVCYDVMPYLKCFQEHCRKIGAKLFLAPPVIERGAFLSQRSFIEKLSRDLSDAGFPFIGEPQTYAFDAAEMYNTVYHPNWIGLQKRTQRLVCDLQRAMAQ